MAVKDISTIKSEIDSEIVNKDFTTGADVGTRLKDMADSGAIADNTVGNEKLDNSDTLGIGESSPDQSFDLHVGSDGLYSNGNSYFTNLATGIGNSGANTSFDLHVGANGLLSDGTTVINGDLGTHGTPSADLDIGANQGSDRSVWIRSSSSSYFLISTNGSSGVSEIGALSFSGNSELSLKTDNGSNSIEALRLDSEQHTILKQNTTHPGSSSSPVLQFGSNGAGIYIDSNGNPVAVDEDGNTNILVP